MIEVPCTACGGRRLKPESLAVTIDGQNIGEVVELPITEALAFFESVPVRGERHARARSGDRRPDSQGSARAAALPRRRRARLSHARPLGRIAVGRRGAAHSARDADRLAARRRAVHPRRAVDRPAPARQRAAARDARAAARPRQHGHRRRARRGDDARGRPRHRPRARAPASTAAQVIADGTVDEIMRESGVDHGKLSQRRAEDRDAGDAPAGRAAARRFASRARASTTCAISTSRFRSDCSSPSPACRARASRR